MIDRLLGRMASTLVLGLSLALLSLGTANANSPRDILLRDADPKAGGQYVRTRFLQLINKPFAANDGRKKALLVGDSHAQDFYNVLLEGNFLQNYQWRVRYIPTRCQLYLGNENVNQFIKPSDARLCATSDNLDKAREQIQQADLVILAANWQDWSAQRLASSIRQLQLKPNQALRVVGRKSFGRINAREYLRMPEAEWRNLRNPVDAQQTAINQRLRQSLPAGVFVDIHQILCGAGNTCPLFTNDLRLISFDGGHFTPAGARHAGQLLFRSGSLSNLR